MQTGYTRTGSAPEALAFDWVKFIIGSIKGLVKRTGWTLGAGGRLMSPWDEIAGVKQAFESESRLKIAGAELVDKKV